MAEKRSPELCSPSRAAELLGLDPGEIGSLVLEGTLRRVKLADGSDDALYLLGHDVDRMLADRDPQALAAKVRRFDGSGGDDAEDARTAASTVPRL